DTIRYFFNGALPVGTYTAQSLAAWHDSSGTTNEARTYTFRVVLPRQDVAAPFTVALPPDPANPTAPIVYSVDVNIANGQSPSRYIDVIYTATPGSQLDYASILDTGAEFEVTGATLASQPPTPIAMSVDASGVSALDPVAQPSTAIHGDGTVNAQDWYALLAREGVTRFRYAISGAWTSGDVTITFRAYNANGNGWRDATGNSSIAETRPFVIEGPTARIVTPAN